MRQRIFAALGCFVVASAALPRSSNPAMAQSRIPASSTARLRESERPTPAVKDVAPLLGRSLRGRTAVEIARQLADAKRPDDRRRAVARARSSLPDDEQLAFLASLTDRGSPLENDPRALLEVARALSRFDTNERAMRALLQLTTVDVHDSLDVPHSEEYSAWTRRTAAMAFAQNQNAKMEELAPEIVAAIESSDESDALWTEAFSIPRKAPAPAELVEHLPLAFAAARDLRAADTLWAATQQNQQASQILGMARLGDRRALKFLVTPPAETAQTLSSSRSPVDETMQWAEAMVRLRAPKWEERVLELLDDEHYSHAAVLLARNLPSEKVVQKLGARAAFHLNEEERTTAIEVLGTIPHVLALRTLLSLSLLEPTQLDAFRALAVHPSPEALRVLEQFVDEPPKVANPARLVRHALRAYASRATLRGESSASLELRARALLSSSSGADRSVAAFALVASGASAATSLGKSADPSTRRGVASGLRTRSDAVESARTLLAEESDAHARMLLSFAAKTTTTPALGTMLTLERDVLDAYTKGVTLAPNAYLARAQAMNQASAARRVAFLQGMCDGPNANVMSERLAEAYSGEIEANVRATLVRCLARLALEDVPADVQWALRVASWSERSPRLRSVARSAMAHCATCAVTPPRALVSSWLNLVAASGATGSFSGVVVTVDGELVPVVFDEDGIATLIGVAAEGSQLVLSPRYE